MPTLPVNYFLKYIEASSTLQLGEKDRSLTEGQIDEIYDELDFCWWKLTEKQREEINRLARQSS